MWAILQEIKLANECGFKKIQVSSDSLLAMEVIKGKWQCPWRILCLHQIWHEASFLDEFEMKHTWREANQAADLLTSMATTEEESILEPHEFPNNLNVLSVQDFTDCIYTRM